MARWRLLDLLDPVLFSAHIFVSTRAIGGTEAWRSRAGFFEVKSRCFRTRGIGRPSKTAAFTEEVTTWLRDEPELPTQELLCRAEESGYAGNKTAFHALVASARPPRATPIARFEGLPGELSQHDFGHVDVTFVDRRTKRIHSFRRAFSMGLAEAGVNAQPAAFLAA